MNERLRNLGKRIREARLRQGMSQEELSEKCCINPSYIGQIERGEKSPSLQTLWAIADGLNMNMRLLFASPETEQELAIQRLVDTVSNRTPGEIVKIAKICSILIEEGIEIS
ncbi:MAG: helix-turn-helix transcriptional regulator [Firmicutes bacterium]|nr:helix-turn-helix transcriptional regulator [Bacillota bacterium]MDD4335818.1 helix-turn-helix transcriptional regulator [Bacillota bacterium]MDD4792067.1 helix-turn-helix transcriptional regulator [Bacillota bacterium]